MINQLTNRYNYSNTSTQTFQIGEARFSYRELGPKDGKPLVMLNHFLATIDHWDPAIVDGFATQFRVIVFDNRGIGGSNGNVALNIEQMAQDAVTFIQGMQLTDVNLFGFSMGGFVAQEALQLAPELFDKVILAGTGPSQLEKTEELPLLMKQAMQFSQDNNKHHKHFLFFAQTDESQQAADEFIARIESRREDDRVADSGLEVMQAHVAAIQSWAVKGDTWLEQIKHPTFIANGDNDIMVATKYSFRLHELIENSTLAIYPNAGHGGIFQYPALFMEQALQFLKTNG